MNKKGLQLLIHPEKLAIVQLSPQDTIPNWATNGEFFSITRTQEELSMVCLEKNIPKEIFAGTVLQDQNQNINLQKINIQTGFVALQVQGVLDFSLTGILAAILVPLAQADISIFALSSYNTDYILIRDEKLTKAIPVLKQAGYQI